MVALEKEVMLLFFCSVNSRRISITTTLPLAVERCLFYLQSRATRHYNCLCRPKNPTCVIELPQRDVQQPSVLKSPTQFITK